QRRGGVTRRLMAWRSENVPARFAEQSDARVVTRSVHRRAGRRFEEDGRWFSPEILHLSFEHAGQVEAAFREVPPCGDYCYAEERCDRGYRQTFELMHDQDCPTTGR